MRPCLCFDRKRRSVKKSKTPINTNTCKKEVLDMKIISLPFVEEISAKNWSEECFKQLRDACVFALHGTSKVIRKLLGFKVKREDFSKVQSSGNCLE